MMNGASRCVGARTWASIGAKVAPFHSVIKHLGFFLDLEESTLMSDIKCAETLKLLNYKYAAADANEPKLENTDNMGGDGGDGGGQTSCSGTCWF